MSNNYNIASNSLLKRQSTETETDFAAKKAKLTESNLNDHSNDSKAELQLDQLNAESAEGRSSQTKHLNSFILRGQNRNVQIFPSQIVWCRHEKSAFWPAMVWPSKLGKITDDRKRKVLVSFFGENSTNIWMKLDNVFPFDGLQSFDKMKDSVNVLLLTRQMKKDYDFAFNVTMNEMWHRAVAEAICCMRKDREGRLSLFLTFSSSYKYRKIRKNSLHRRSIALNTSNRCLVKASRVNDEISRVESFINTVSFSTPETPIDARETPHSEKMFSKFITESIASCRFTDGVNNRCSICITDQTIDQKLIKCGGTCDGYFHQKCVEKGAPQDLSHRDDAGGPNDFICENCTSESKTLCFICKASEDSPGSQMLNCKVSHCLRRYHTTCLLSWPQSHWTGSDEDFTCPSHQCHQCGPDPNESKRKAYLTTCIKCPTAVHNDASCIHAGTVILSDTRHICIRHRQLRKNASNLDYCYICDMAYNLVRCRACPHSYHAQCLPTTSTSNSTCPKCLNGQHPVYGDIVWAKLYTYAWWPAMIVPPHCIPENIRTDEHLPHDICVCFFGDYTFSFIDRQSIYAFEEDNFALFTENGSKFSDAILSARKWALRAKSIKRQQSAPSTSTTVGTVESPTPFESIVKNVFVSPATRIIDSNNEASSCQCRAEEKENDDPCGVSSNCLNRASCTECNDLCPNAEKCKNKCIQQGKYAEVSLKYFGSKGFGLVASDWIPSGTIVQQYTGEVITTPEFEHRVQNRLRSNVYFMKYTKEHYIDGETKGSVARYINHSCNPNCEFRLWSVNGENVVVVIALKNIPKDTEITCKYDWSRQVPCLCNEENCSGIC
ncbi:probable histone-lysine N-methyltransferase Mes-4 [Bradysia coprophila]|uniref:probable histone-lysine N-methyltransferase Mes-4 n=1 Tax=Bradysia coprophila TaxID=38358 RepID=UPI00187DB35F|nr:probable histone-lysine N-methyltransferase Mes-4 [Bradysia coprophila]